MAWRHAAFPSMALQVCGCIIVQPHNCAQTLLKHLRWFSSHNSMEAPTRHSVMPHSMTSIAQIWKYGDTPWATAARLTTMTMWKHPLGTAPCAAIALRPTRTIIWHSGNHRAQSYSLGTASGMCLHNYAIIRLCTGAAIAFAVLQLTQSHGDTL